MAAGIRLTLSRASFGVYLLHPMVLDVLRKANILPAAIWENPFAGIPVLVPVMGGIAFLVSWGLLHVPGLRRLVS